MTYVHKKDIIRDAQTLGLVASEGRIMHYDYDKFRFDNGLNL